LQVYFNLELKKFLLRSFFYGTSSKKVQGANYTHTMPAPAGATALKNDIPVIDNPFAAPL